MTDIKTFQSSQEKYFGDNASTMGKIAGHGQYVHAYARPEYDSAVVLGRFQPLHAGHIDLIKRAFQEAKKVLVVIGSVNEAPSIKNPFSYDMREKMIIDEFAKECAEGRLIVAGLEDYTYRNEAWDKTFTALVKSRLSGNIVWVTYGKDTATSKYIDESDVKFKRIYHTPKDGSINATDIRDKFFSDAPVSVIPHITNNVRVMLDSYRLTDNYNIFVNELKAIEEYKASWSSAPFPPMFVAVDGVCVWHDHWNKPHFLLIKRKSEFGNGKIALPGGYLDQHETVLEGAKREVLEETGLAIGREWSLDYTTVFDAPNRSPRGRMITFAHYWSSIAKEKPTVKGADDAAEAFWLPIDEVYKNKNKFFSDHYHILAKQYPEVEDFK